MNPLQSRKMTARLQAASPPGRPIFLRTSANSGHGHGSSLSVRINQRADTYSFLFDQLGMRYPGIMGFAPAHAATEHKLEDQLQSLASPAQIRDWHREFSATAHPAASVENNHLAGVVADAWRKQGWEDVTLRHYDVLHSSPARRIARDGGPGAIPGHAPRGRLRRRSGDARCGGIAAYFGYSASGEITAEVVYAHNGNPEDYELLRKQRRQRTWQDRHRPLLQSLQLSRLQGADRRARGRGGAADLLGPGGGRLHARGKVFPDGPWGPESHIQRGAITYDFIVPGDPFTPGWASLPGARRVAAYEARSLPKIIALPLSWHDAKPLLENMNGAEAPPEWRGALPITYRFTGACACT